ncbi:MAG: FKBP-type peptidyl-prolyl cis-trans isomerase [Candidatus Methanoperedens sp.]|nr:FKBP-type peptidyl-prolyl cis-trans isomerase [Candidatus Methanoperedens sp.]
MKKILILIAAAIILFSGCINQKTDNQKTVKIGDNVSVDYIGKVDGSVVVTSIESVAKENNLSSSNRKYVPINFTVGSGMVIKGFDKGVIGMKVGESRMLTIPPEEGFGQRDPNLIKIIPVIQNISSTTTFPRVFNVSVDQFESTFGSNHSIGDIVKIPDTNITATVKNMTASNISLSYNSVVGAQVSQLPWKETVIKIDENIITTKFETKKNDIVQLPNSAWNSTVIDVNSENITLRHNRIQDTQMLTPSGNVRVHFNDTYITIDMNNELAGQTFVFNVTVRSIN